MSKNAEQGADTLDVNTGAAAIEGLLSDDLDLGDQDEQVERDEGDNAPVESDEDEGAEDVEDDDLDGEDADEDDDFDAESDDEVDDEADEATEDDEDSPPTYKVKVDGEESEVTLEEALAGYQRQQAFTKRMQAVAEERKSISETVEAFTARGQEYLDNLVLVERALAGAEPDWQQLKAQDPKKYADARIAWDERKAQLDQIRTEQQKVRQEMNNALEDQKQRTLAVEAEKLEAALPEWAADPDAKRDEQRKIVQFAQTTYGFTPQELGSVVDHRVILLLRDAMAQHELRSQGTKAKDVAREKRRKSPTLQPGNPKAAKAKSKSRKKNSARKKLSQTGRIDDAAAVLFDLIPD